MIANKKAKRLEPSIGDLIEWDGKTYQCVPSIDGTCGGCAWWCIHCNHIEMLRHMEFMELMCPDREPYGEGRADGESVIYIEYSPIKSVK